MEKITLLLELLFAVLNFQMTFGNSTIREGRFDNFYIVVYVCVCILD